MEAKIKELSALAMAVLVLMVAAAILQYYGANAQVPEKKQENGMVSGMELLDTEVSQEEQELLEHQMQLELPQGIGQEQIRVKSDVLQERISIYIPGIDEEYYFEHPLRGNSTHINDLKLGTEGREGVIEITLDSVYEVDAKVEDSWLYIDFIPPEDLYEKVIVIDAGHGGSEPGAVKQGIYEKDLNLAIVLKLKELLDQHPEWKVYYTRTEDVHVSLYDRVDLANLSNADMFISVHNNSTRTGEMTDYSGTEVMYDENKAGGELGTEQLSRILLEETTEACGSRNLGLALGHSIYIIRTSEVPVALVEVGFMTDPGELAKLNTDEYQHKVAQGIYQGILRAIEEGF